MPIVKLGLMLIEYAIGFQILLKKILYSQEAVLPSIAVPINSNLVSEAIAPSSRYKTILTPQIKEDSQISVYPNPFNQLLTIDYQLAESGQVAITLFDISGKKIKQLTNQYQEKGPYQLTLNSENLETGLYFIHANLKGTVKVKKVYLVR